MSDIALSAAADVRVMNYDRAVVNPYTANEALTVGDFVYEVITTGKVAKADADAGTPAERVIGIVVESFDGETAIAAGAICSVCEFGLVTGFASLVIGALSYLSNTAAKAATTAGHFNRIIGRNVSAATMMVAPVMSDAAST